MPTALSLPPTHRAITQSAKGALVISSIPLPPLLPGWVLVKTAAVALNPADHKMPARFPAPGSTAGWDFAGTIVRTCPPLASTLQIGDRVCGAVHGSNPSDPAAGAFAEYVRAEPELLLRVPADMGWEAAAALGGVGHGTLSLALWDSLGVPGRVDRPMGTGDEGEEREGRYVLVYGGSTATGTLAIQLLRL
jgi:NADPH:quinone reductase-like Zn-dependent oxidoreductase